MVLLGLVLAAGIIDALTWRGDFSAIELSAADLPPDRDTAAVALRVAGYPDGDGLTAEGVGAFCKPDSCVS